MTSAVIRGTDVIDFAVVFHIAISLFIMHITQLSLLDQFVLSAFITLLNL